MGAIPVARAGTLLLTVLAITAAVLVTEVVGGVITGSLALLADAGHVFADVAGLGLAVLAVTFAAKSPTAQRTHGYYRLEILAAVVNGMLLFAIAAWILYQGHGASADATQEPGAARQRPRCFPAAGIIGSRAAVSRIPCAAARPGSARSVTPPAART
jgi:divalent metal cation (Fe/Co/Zn/Cd) transporter